MTTQTEEPQTDTGEEEEKEKTRGSVMVSMPIEMKALVKEKAAEGGVATNAFVRQLLADAVGFEGELTMGRKRLRKYATEEERKVASKARSKARREVVKELLERYKDEVTGLLETAETEALEASRTEAT